MSPAPRQLVVGAALIADGRVLAARRTSPAEAAGRWEFPGGKVEPGEDPAAGLVREVDEELGCEVEVLHWLTPTVPIDDTLELRVAACRLRAGDALPREHDAIRWLAADELDQVDWLETDRPFLAEVSIRLLGPAP